MVGGTRLFVLLLYASVLVAASLEFFTSQRTWYGSWWIYNSYVLIVTGVFVFFGIVMLFTSTRRGTDDYSLPVPRLLLVTLGFVLLSLSGLALVYWGKSLGAWAIPLSILLLYGFLFIVLGSRSISQRDGIRLFLYATGIIIMIMVPVHEAFGIARQDISGTDAGAYYLTLLNLVLFTAGLIPALFAVQSLESRDGYLGAWLIGAMAIFLIAFHEQINILASGTYSPYDRLLALIGITFSLLPLALYVWREQVYIHLWRRLAVANHKIEAGDYPGADKDADTAIRQCARVGIEDRFALPWSIKADAEYRMKEYNKALVHYETALTIDPNDSISWCHVGNMNAFEGKQELAMKAYDRALKADPTNAYAWNNKGAIYQSLAMYEDALVCFDKAASYMPGLFDAHMNMAKLFSKTSHTADAVEHYRIAAGIRPDSETAREGLKREFYRGMCLDQINGWEQLGLDTSYLRTMLEQDPTNFAKKTKEFLANLVDQRTEMAVAPGMEHIDVNKAIKMILEVTEGEGATIEEIMDFTNMKKHDLILPLALLMETDRIHFKTRAGMQVYVSKGKAPDKPPEPPPPPPAPPKQEQPILLLPPHVEKPVVIPPSVPSVAVPIVKAIAQSRAKRAQKKEEREQKERKEEKAKKETKPQPMRITEKEPEPALHRDVVSVEPTVSILVFKKKEPVKPKKR